MRGLRVGTRRSALAKQQTQQVVEALQRERPDLGVEVVEVVTKGDRIVDRSLSEVGGKGLFVSEIEAMLADKTIDFAVHSMKDVPAELAPGLVLGAIPRRADPRDLLVSASGAGLDDLPQGARVGTSSLRRSALLLAKRRDLEVVSLRGNIDTRLRKLAELDAIVLAAAGLVRMGWWDGKHVTVAADLVYKAWPMPVGTFLPAVGQGALALECRADDEFTLGALGSLHDPVAEAETLAERAFLAAVGGSCQVPVAAYARMLEGDVNTLRVQGFVGLPDGSAALFDEVSGKAGAALGERLAATLLTRGGREILEQIERKAAGWQ